MPLYLRMQRALASTEREERAGFRRGGRPSPRKRDFVPTGGSSRRRGSSISALHTPSRPDITFACYKTRERILLVCGGKSEEDEEKKKEKEKNSY